MYVATVVLCPVQFRRLIYDNIRDNSMNNSRQENLLENFQQLGPRVINTYTTDLVLRRATVTSDFDNLSKS